MVKEINSLQNSLIKYIGTLNNKRNIAKGNVTFIEGKKIVLELLKKNYSVKTVLITENYLKEFTQLQTIHNYELIKISDEVSKKISNTVTTAGVFALAEIPTPKEFNPNDRFLVLDTIQDPANVGAIIRSALAFNFKQIILVNSAYPFLPKIVRSSMGYCLSVACFNFSQSEFLEFFKNNNLKLMAANMNGENINELKPLNHNFGIVVGNEGNGISDEIKNLCEKFVSIPMQNRVESLNAAVSISVIMNQLNKF